MRLSSSVFRIMSFIIESKDAPDVVVERSNVVVDCVGSVDSVGSSDDGPIGPIGPIGPMGLTDPIGSTDSVNSVSPRGVEEESVEEGAVAAKARSGEEDWLESSKGCPDGRG